MKKIKDGVVEAWMQRTFAWYLRALLNDAGEMPLDTPVNIKLEWNPRVYASQSRYIEEHTDEQ